MAIFKCKMCGGTIEFNQGDTVGICDSCGTKQTLPRLDDDKKANLYDRANHFRRNNDYDKAMGIYEQILNEDSTDAEAYWSLVLCRYGIEYVEDPAAHKRVPTVNRAQFTSIFDDDNYKSALKYADTTQKTIYEEEAAAINEIQKGILAISQKEEPFDVFICYKETDNNGRRTQDSVLANDLYHQLTQEGFKVFFSRITLEDKLGTAYEPYIFAALNSAKVMVVIGTKPEYFNAVWVKNEWSRYLALIRNGAKKMLIPAYRGMDPYDLPEEFSHLQAQDMSKLGFMQDLIRGIKKIVGTEEPTQAVKETVVVSSGNANTQPLLKRAFMFLEDGNWKEADEYCERVLDLDPECAEAYLGKLMAELGVRKREELKDCEESIAYNSNYDKAIRYGNENFRQELGGYEEYIVERNEQERLGCLYIRAISMLEQADSQSTCELAAEAFEKCIEYKDSKEKKAECLEKAEACRKDKIYNEAMANMKKEYLTCYEEALESLKSIPSWRDASEQAQICEKAIEEIKKEEEERKKKNKKIAKIAIPIVCVCIALVVLLIEVIIPNGKYKDALVLYEAGEYAEAIAAFEELGDYKDSATMLERAQEGKSESDYQEALDLIAKGESVKAYEILSSLDGYKDSAARKNGIRLDYEKAKIKAAEVGDVVTFGRYEQDNNFENGDENVEWIVVAKKEGKKLLLSKYALDCIKYNLEDETVEWADCRIRRWLNDEFFKASFDVNEQKYIKSTTIADEEAKKTKDKIFLLSTGEVERYLMKQYYAIGSVVPCSPTEYARQKGATVYDDGNCKWFLRPNAWGPKCATNDGWIGSASYYRSEDQDGIAIRPAMWISLE